MNNREQFEVWAKKVFCGYSFGMLDKTTYFDSDIDSAYIGWQACTESKQAELDKVNARIAQLKQFIAENVYPDEKYDEIITNSPDTWLLDHDKAVESKVLNEAADSHSAGYVSEARLRKMAESR